VFERFYRVPEIEVQTGSSVGFGLGLYISQQIVLQHDGYFAVESTPGHGSTFTIFLPFSPPASEYDPSGVSSSTAQI
jgi:two-component system, sensor histidine kinase and response regulator